MQKIFDHFKTNAGVWTFGLFMAAVAGGIYQFTVFMVSAQVTPVKAHLDAQVERLDAADGNTNRTISGIEKRMILYFDELRENISLLDKKIDTKITRLNQKIDTKITRLNEKIDRKITMLDQKIDRQIGLLDQKIEKKFDQLDKKISRLDEKMDKKFDLILLRLPPLKK